MGCRMKLERKLGFAFNGYGLKWRKKIMILYGAGNENIIYAEPFLEGETADGYDHKLDRQSSGIQIYDYILQITKENWGKA
ncbi:hypothetical protein BPOR_0146g00090 [Botrytis porri]|uniref:Uncharacterized protein n=1 Tax=Botrytis porri TaxID=87229 RepID=A0A4Z1KWB4_9HELO|nr:hypothetical protein BPOR_0146g00090 [Botrytis porri]